MIKLLIADDHNLFRQGIISMLSDQKDFDIIGEASDGRELVEKYTKLKPDVVLSDISMPLKSGPDAIKSITNKYNNVKVLFLSQFTGDDYLYSVINSGGLGLISKTCLKEELVYAIHEVYQGRKYFKGKSEKELDSIIKRFEDLKMSDISIENSPLTAKEQEVLRLVGDGLTSEQIAAKLKMSKRTVDTHRYRIIGALGLSSVSELIRYAVLKNVEQNRIDFTSN